jgi:hypothetical protein
MEPQLREEIILWWKGALWLGGYLKCSVEEELVLLVLKAHAMEAHSKAQKADQCTPLNKYI